MWVFGGGDTVVYLLDPTRSRAVPEQHFPQNASGVLLVDRYSAYKALAQVKEGTLLLAFCWAQVRRDLILDHVVERQQLHATEAEVSERITQLAERRQMPAAELRASLEKAKRLRDVERSLTEEKVFAYLLSQSTVESP